MFEGFVNRHDLAYALRVLRLETLDSKDLPAGNTWSQDSAAKWNARVHEACRLLVGEERLNRPHPFPIPRGYHNAAMLLRVHPTSPDHVKPDQIFGALTFLKQKIAAERQQTLPKPKLIHRGETILEAAHRHRLAKLASGTPSLWASAGNALLKSRNRVFRNICEKAPTRWRAKVERFIHGNFNLH